MPQDVAGIPGVEYTQAHPQCCVGANGRGDDACRPLCGQNQVDAQAAALRRDPYEAFQDVGVLGGERGELVNRDHESRRCLGSIHRRDILGTHARQEPLAASDLGLQGGQRPPRRRRVEVGEHSGGMGQAGQGPERRPALVVHQDQGETRRRQVEGELKQPGGQHLGFSRSGRPRHECVGSVSHEVGVDGVGVAHAEHRRQGIGPALGEATTPARTDAVAVDPAGDLLQKNPVGRRRPVRGPCRDDTGQFSSRLPPPLAQVRGG